MRSGCQVIRGRCRCAPLFCNGFGEEEADLGMAGIHLEVAGTVLEVAGTLGLGFKALRFRLQVYVSAPGRGGGVAKIFAA